MNKLIRIIAVITFFCVFSCKVVSKDFFCFGTEEYKQKEKKNRINTDEAADLFAKYFFEKHPEKNKIKVNLNINKLQNLQNLNFLFKFRKSFLGYNSIYNKLIIINIQKISPEAIRKVQNIIFQKFKSNIFKVYSIENQLF